MHYKLVAEGSTTGVIQPASQEANQLIDECKSTNDLAKNLADRGFPHGTWISARKQTSARGRQGRRWESLEGNLFLSLVCRIENLALWTWIPLTTAVAVAQCIQTEFPSLAVQVKWPNDLWLNSAKLGGILCEGFPRPVNPFVIIGIGLNCVAVPRNLDRPIADLASSVGLGIPYADRLRPLILQQLELDLGVLKSQGPASIRSRYDQIALFQSGTSITWADGLRTGLVNGLGPQGELEVKQNASGPIERLYAEEISVKSWIF